MKPSGPHREGHSKPDEVDHFLMLQLSETLHTLAVQGDDLSASWDRSARDWAPIARALTDGPLMDTPVANDAAGVGSPGSHGCHPADRAGRSCPSEPGAG